jgi:hypothetical protein
MLALTLLAFSSAVLLSANHLFVVWRWGDQRRVPVTLARAAHITCGARRTVTTIDQHTRRSRPSQPVGCEPKSHTLTARTLQLLSDRKFQEKIRNATPSHMEPGTAMGFLGHELPVIVCCLNNTSLIIHQ